MIDSWVQVCRHCVDVIVDVPPSVLLITVLATSLGLFVLVSRPARFCGCATNFLARN